MLELSFDMGVNKSTSKNQWQCPVQKDGVRTLYVPDKSSKHLPTHEQRRFRCVPGRTVFEAEGKRFRIVSVDLREKLKSLDSDPVAAAAERVRATMAPAPAKKRKNRRYVPSTDSTAQKGSSSRRNGKKARKAAAAAR